MECCASWRQAAPTTSSSFSAFAARNRDLVRKRQIYAEAGVLEYWPIDPQNDTVAQLELHDGAYVDRAVLGVGDVLTTPLLPGLEIPLADIFQHRRRPARDDE